MRPLAADRLSSIGVCAYVLFIAATLKGAAVAAQPSGRSLLSESDHKYEVHDAIKLYANKVGPFSNPR